LLRLFKSNEGLFENYVSICNVGDYDGPDSTMPRLLYGPDSIVLPLNRDMYYGSGLQQASEICGKDGKGRLPLPRAFEGGIEAIFRLLLAGATHTEAVPHGGLVLHEVVVRLLFDQASYIEAEDTGGEIALL
jgi:hypothetical protein